MFVEQGGRRIFSTGDPMYNSEMASVFARIRHFNIINALNPGYQEGANLAMSEGAGRSLFSNYDWVIRLNPDVIILDSRWILKTMLTPDVDAIFVDCRDICRFGNCVNSSVKIHTDFFAIRPRVLRPNSFNGSTFALFSNAEQTATYEFRDILQSGRHRWLPGTGPMEGHCR